MIHIMKYLHIKINASENAREPLIALLKELGMNGIHEDELINAYFDEQADYQNIFASIKELEKHLAIDNPESRMDIVHQYLPETDWNEEWKKSFTPIKIGNTLVITPPWLATDGTRTEIIVDPAMAFGTGHHETTRRCLELIEKHASDTDPTDFLDLGAGTGILSIAASKLGFKRVIAIDNDAMAYDAAQINRELNRLNNIDIVLGTISYANGIFSMIAANLISETLIENASAISSLVADHGVLILSGMLDGQQADVINAYTGSGMAHKETFRDDKWITLLFRKP
ncbi:MAG: 50S ribosomal protein L11 methyltransferase [Nitrospiraceae bacterium]|nr:50S ribosomal protein L11 methyltransferase [Nitrospiraceae bacterium]